MSLKLKIELAIENAPKELPSYTKMEVTCLPHEGSFLQHWEEGTSYLLRVMAVVDSIQGATVYAAYVGETVVALPDVLRAKQSALSRVERLILWNQLELQKKGKTGFEKQELASGQEVLSQGFESYYENVLRPIDSSSVSTEDCRYVLKVLSMYRAFDTFAAANKGHGFESHAWFRFWGFDGNDEPEYVNLVNFVIITQGLFQEIKPDFDKNGGNSHCRTSDTYRKMLAIWDGLPNQHFMKPAEIQQVLEASGI